MDADPRAVAARLRAEAERSDQRRLLVLAGGREATYDAARAVLSGFDRGSVTLVGERDALDCERVAHARSGELLGTTRRAVAVDAHDRLDPNTLGRVVGAVDGGGLLVLLTPPLAAWPDRTDGFDRTLAVPPHDPGDVGGRFRRRLVETLPSHPGVAVVDADRGVVERDGLTDPPPRSRGDPPGPPDDAVFPAAAYGACLTADQVAAVAALEALAPARGTRDPDADGTGDGGADPRAVVVEADRGRGKSSAAGIAAAAVAARGGEVLVTAPEYRSAAEVFARAEEVLAAIEGDRAPAAGDDRTVASASGGRVRYRPPAAATDLAGEADAVVVDEAAAIPVGTLSALLAADRVAFTTTVHGYEGAGRGFSVRFRDRLAASDHRVTDLRIDEPIRYAPGDPVETWAFRALLLDARPPVDQLVADADPEAVEYRALTPGDLVADEHLLREAFGLLVLAHYRTEPDDLARLLDAPNVCVRALLFEGHVVSVALLAREGGLPETLRRETYEGARIRGHMIPDVLVSQLRDEAAGVPEGYRVMRIATHHAARSRGLGSTLLSRIRTEFADDVDWLGTGFGATPRLVRFWRANGYRAIHLSVTRNDRSGEHSVLMLDPTSEAGRALRDRHARRFVDRAPGALSDPLRDADPDVVRAALRAAAVGREPSLSDHEWRTVAGAAYGPGLFKADPEPFRRLVAAALADPDAGDALSAREERLLVATTLQGRDADAVADALDYHSAGECLRAVGDALAVLVDRYGGAVARAERDRYD
jgi:tRNA(Met) cytidine acetyltransferase